MTASVLSTFARAAAAASRSLSSALCASASTAEM